LSKNVTKNLLLKYLSSVLEHPVYHLTTATSCLMKTHKKLVK